jgi:hypothetical protein
LAIMHSSMTGIHAARIFSAVYDVDRMPRG